MAGVLRVCNQNKKQMMDTFIQRGGERDQMNHGHFALETNGKIHVEILNPQ